jgi:transcriptional regulator of acetoin/glycerol metabolism
VARQPAHDETSPLRARDMLAPEPPRVPLPLRSSHLVAPLAAARAQTLPPQTSRGLQPTPSFADARLQAHLSTARRVIARGTPVLLRGETGAGKEVFAHAVHNGSPRASGPFIAINCASLPENLIESELFGYRAGAFTGAERRGRRGKIALSDGGTLFLDEIGDMPLGLQARLLRVLDERTVTPLGADDAQPVDFQLLSASHRHLGDLVAEGRFREDLYYRLAGIELMLPALRERSDRAELIRSVLADEGAPDAALSPAVWDLLMRHPWPGNVRQLRHVLRSAVALADGAVMTPEHLPSLLLTAPAAVPGLGPAGQDGAPHAAATEPPVVLAPALAQERPDLLALLETQRWNLTQVANDLGVSRNTLYRRMHKLHIPVTQSG